ncbi:YjbH domain-containing protein [Govanella unica]|uniref:YjbH domain-containing protein n=1 Tax=Govanella unica TaxID=2975056 RepID=A0A9X3TX51_9PROT|nr:YjbH domain-containing protein [Govania unica]MDA5193391.1 YjbH domain-containing protein [Govania unica]
MRLYRAGSKAGRGVSRSARLLSVAGLCSWTALSVGGFGAEAQTIAPTGASDFSAYISDAASPGLLGGVGLLATPTARMLPDGEVVFGTSFQDPFYGAYLTWQALPWLEATARFSDAHGTADDFDRALDLKIRLYEGGSFPSVAIGFRDALGHGPFAGEYLVFSKAFGKFDVSAGVGWGYLGSRDSLGNPLSRITGRTRDRHSGGVPQLRNYFSGDFGVFGGIAYVTPVQGLSLKLEYDGGDPRGLPLDEPARGGFPLNIGVDYRPLSWVHVSAGLLRGNALGLSLALRFNPEQLVPAQKRFDPAPIAVAVSPQPDPDQGAQTIDAVMLAKLAASPNVALSNGLPAETVMRVTRALYFAGLDEPLIDVNATGTLTVTLSLAPGLEARQALLAAEVTFANLPPGYDAILIRNRLGSEAGGAGQRFTRDMVASFTRADASFNDLLQSGGVRGVTLRGGDVEASVNGSEGTAASAAVALSGLVPEDGKVTVETADSLTRAAAADLTVVRQQSQIASLFEKAGLRLRSLDIKGRAAVITADLTRDMGADRLQRAATQARAILGASVDAVELTAYRSDRAVAVVTAPKKPPEKDILPSGYRANPFADAKHPVLKHTAFFGYVAASAPPPAAVPPVPEPLPPLDKPQRLAPLTTAEASDIFDRARDEGLRPVAARLDGRTATLAFANDRYGQPAKAIGRAARALSAGQPLDVDWFELVTVEDGVEAGRLRFLRRDFERAANGLGSPEEVWIHTEFSRAQADFPESRDWRLAKDGWYGFRWAVYPEVVQHFGSGADGYRVGLYGNASASLDLLRHVKLTATLSRELGGTLDEINGRPAGAGPVVRSDIARYAADGRTALRDARVDYTAQPLNDVYLRLSAGYFERMYGGVGAELLYVPQASRFAFGLDLNHVKKRGYDQKFGFADYAVTTGQATLYHTWSRYGLDTRLSVGRYLAGDWGATLDVSRLFENGVRFGAWATVTDMSNARYGGDAPAKGLYLSVPLDLVLPWSMRRDFGLAFRALNRDGGQTLDKGPGLYDLLRDGARPSLEADWRNLLY